MGKKQVAVKASAKEYVFEVPEDATHAQLQSYLRDPKKAVFLTPDQKKFAQVSKEVLLNLSEITWTCPDATLLGEILEKEGIGEFLSLAPKRFHPDLVMEFYENAMNAKDLNSFSTTVMGFPIVVTVDLIAEHFGLPKKGVSISHYRGANPRAMEETWSQWKLSTGSAFKFSAKTTDLAPFYCWIRNKS